MFSRCRLNDRFTSREESARVGPAVDENRLQRIGRIEGDVAAIGASGREIDPLL